MAARISKGQRRAFALGCFLSIRLIQARPCKREWSERQAVSFLHSLAFSHSIVPSHKLAPPWQRIYLLNSDHVISLCCSLCLNDSISCCCVHIDRDQPMTATHHAPIVTQTPLQTLHFCW
jgi:hypothetical protein